MTRGRTRLDSGIPPSFSPTPTSSPLPSPLGLVQPVGDWQELSVGCLTWNFAVDTGNGFGGLGNPMQRIQPASPIWQGEEQGALRRGRNVVRMVVTLD